MAIEDYYVPLEVWRGTPKTDIRNNTTFGNFIKNSDIQGVINQASFNDSMQAMQLQVDISHKLYTAITSDIKSQDQIRNNTTIYRVVGKPKNTVNRNHHLKVMLQELGVDNNG